MFAVDAGDTQGVGQIIQKHSLRGKVVGGGYDLLPGTLRLVDQGFLNFTIDQQPYLQGFYPVMQLFLYKLSGGLVAPSDTNTGLLFVTKANVRPYLTTKTRYEGSSSKRRSTRSPAAEPVAEVQRRKCDAPASAGASPARFSGAARRASSPSPSR